MTDHDEATGATPPDRDASTARSAGAMLRAAREQRGVHIAALAAAIKVPQRKLEALEGDRYDELPDLTFTRALAQSVCRSLKIDMQPVLDRLPQAGISPKLAQVGSGINAPFRDRPGRTEPTDWSWLRRPVVWGTAAVLLAAVGLAFLPDDWLDRDVRTRAPAAAVTPPVTEAASAPAASVTLEVPTTPVLDAAAPASAPLAVERQTTGVSSLVLKASADSWVEVQDVSGQVLLQRKLAAGESAGVDGARPLRVTVGNAAATQLLLGGRPLELAPHTVGNIARLQID